MSVESHRRLLGGVRREVGEAKSDKASGKVNGKVRRLTLDEAMEKLDREAPAMRALVAFALELAGTDKLPPPSPAPLAGDTPTILIPDVPVLPPRAEPVSRWINGKRPGPHDILTWEEAMQVPWFDPFAEPER